MRVDGSDRIAQTAQQGLWQSGSHEPNVYNYVYPGRRFRSDVTYNEKSVDGWRSPSAYSVRFVELDPFPGTIEYRSSSGPYWYGWRTGCNYPFNLGWISLPGSRENELKTRALLQVKDQKINLALTLAFIGDTSDMIYRRATQMARFLTAARTRDVKKMRRILRQAGKPVGKRLSDNVLEFQYGWRQLANDVQGAAQELDRGLRNLHQFVYGRAQSKESVDRSHVDSRVYINYHIGDYHWNLQEEQIHKVVLTYSVDCNWSGKMSQLGLLNPFVVVADATAFSFAVNWVWPIVDWMSTIDATVGLTFRGGTYTRVAKCEGTVDVKPVAHRDYPVAIGTSNSSLKYFLMDRKVVDDFVHPFYLTNPFTGSLQRALNALALLGQRVR